MTDTGGHADQPVLSVIIACLDAEATLATQLDALAGQPCPVAWELLVCDNGSTDGTVELARRYADRVPGLRVVDASAVRGAGAARTRGAQEARGVWLAFCDADDEVAGDWLTTMSRALSEHRFVAGSFEATRLNGARVLRSRPLDQQSQLQSADFGARLPHAGAGNLGIHRSDFLELGGFDPTMPWLEDTEFSWRAQLAGVPLTFRPEVVVHVRLRSTFLGMYHQGYQYGAAYAVLEHRYGSASPGAAGSADAPSTGRGAGGGPGRGRAGRARRAAGWLVDHLVGGRLAWRAGWVVGHRSRRAREVIAAAGAGPGPVGGQVGGQGL